MRNKNKGTITISVNNNITKDEIKEIRRQFKSDECYKDYKLNIIISGCEDLKQNVHDFIKTGIKY